MLQSLESRVERKMAFNLEISLTFVEHCSQCLPYWFWSDGLGLLLGIRISLKLSSISTLGLKGLLRLIQPFGADQQSHEWMLMLHELHVKSVKVSKIKQRNVDPTWLMVSPLLPALCVFWEPIVTLQCPLIWNPVIVYMRYILLSLKVTIFET